METNNQSSTVQHPQQIILRVQKSVGIALVLTFFFGPLGMLYSTVTGAIIMFLVSVFAAIFTLGIGLLFTWPICMIWAAMAVKNYNADLNHH